MSARQSCPVVSPAPPASDAFVRAVVEASPEAIVVSDEAGFIVFVNRRCASDFGYATDELVGKPIELLVPERLRGRHRTHRAAFARAPTADPMRRVDVRARRRDGAEFRADVLVSVMVMPEATYYVTSVRDTTEREKTAADLRESEQRFRLAFDDSPIGVALVGLDGRFLKVNRALSLMVGYTPDELVARTFQDITHPDDVDVDTALAGKLARGEIPSYQLGKRYVKRDGTSVHVMLTGSILRAPDGAPLYFLAQVEDVTERIAAEAAARRSHAQYRELIEQAPEAIFVADLHGRYTHANVAAERLLGYARDELVGKTIEELIPPEDVPRLASERGRLLEAGHVEVSEWMLLRKDGVRVPVEVTAKIQSDGRWIAFVRDVSERKQSEAALRSSRASLARAQRVAHLGSWDWDLRTNEVERSDELLSLFGLAPGSVSSQRLSMVDHLHPDDRERVLALVDAAARDARPYAVEHRIVRADGVERIVLQQGEPMVKDGTAVRVVGTLLDVTERRRAEIAREALLQWLTAVIDRSPVGLLLAHGASGAMVETNPRANSLLGRRVTRVDECADWMRDVTGARLPADQLPGHRALHGESVDWGEYACRRPDGVCVPILVGAAPILDAKGAVDGAVIAFQDITAAKELERLRAEWSSVVAHDLRQPLTTIVLFAQHLLRSARDPAARQGLERIQAAGQRLNRMIHDLMDLSRLDARRLELVRKRVDVVELLRDAVERLALQRHGRAVDVHVAGEIPPVLADPDRVAQIVENLLSNAVKYGSHGTPIVIDARATDHDVAVTVTNEGPGIAPAELPNLFRRFQRTAGARGSKVKGTGLGLYITRELVEAHGGRITVESTPDATTSFRFTLPRAESSST